jgi:hypothetical protein
VIKEGEEPEASVSCDGALITVWKEPVPGFEQDLEIRVFAARLTAPPMPVEKKRHLFFIPLRLLREIACSQMTAGDLIKHGGRIVSAEGEDVPQEGVVTFIDSPGVYARHVDGALAGYAEQLLAGKP